MPAHDLAVSARGDIAITGWSGNEVDFGGGPFADGGAYVAVFAGDEGAHLGSRQLGGGGNNGGCGVCFAEDGGLLLTGWFQKNIDLDDDRPYGLVAHVPPALLVGP